MGQEEQKKDELVCATCRPAVVMRSHPAIGGSCAVCGGKGYKIRPVSETLSFIKKHSSERLPEIKQKKSLPGQMTLFLTGDQD